jgi:hypothetical protein
MRDGIYQVHLKSRELPGFMIGTLCNGRLTGCDQTHHVTGQIRRDGSRFSGRLFMKRHARPAWFHEIANLDDFEVRFSGICGDSFGEFDATIVDKPGIPVVATFQWVCDL